MRAVQLSDLMAAAQAMVLVADNDRVALRDRMLREAEMADRFTRTLGKIHPLWGNGTLKDVARRHGGDKGAALDDPAACDALILLLKGLRRRPRAVRL